MSRLLAGDRPSASERKRHALKLFEGLPERYDRAGALLSFGQDPRWRRAMVRAVEASPAEHVLDVATGTGLVARELVRRYGCAVTALDQSPAMLGAARRRLARDPLLAGRVELVQGEAERLPFPDREFDHLTFTYLLRYVDDPAATLSELARVVRPGGRIAMLEFGIPEAWPLRGLWSLYTRFALPALGRPFGRDWYEVGRFLGRSIPDLYARYPVERIVALWRAAGIERVDVRRISFGAGLVMWGVKGDGDAG